MYSCGCCNATSVLQFASGCYSPSESGDEGCGRGKLPLTVDGIRWRASGLGCHRPSDRTQTTIQTRGRKGKGLERESTGSVPAASATAGPLQERSADSCAAPSAPLPAARLPGDASGREQLYRRRHCCRITAALLKRRAAHFGASLPSTALPCCPRGGRLARDAERCACWEMEQINRHFLCWKTSIFCWVMGVWGSRGCWPKPGAVRLLPLLLQSQKPLFSLYNSCLCTGRWARSSHLHLASSCSQPKPFHL